MVVEGIVVVEVDVVVVINVVVDLINVSETSISFDIFSLLVSIGIFEFVEI